MHGAACCDAGASEPRETASPIHCNLQAYLDQYLAAVPANFIGLSYESQELQNPAFFSPGNRELIARFRELTPKGTLRLGGDTADHAFWSSYPGIVPPARSNRTLVVGDPRPDLTWRVNPAALRDLRGFLDASVSTASTSARACPRSRPPRPTRLRGYSVTG